MSLSSIVKLKDKENIVAVVRHYPLVYTPKIVLAMLLIAAPFFFMVPLLRLKYWGIGIFGLLILVAVYYSARTFITWYWNAFIITSQRVIDIDQRGLFDRIVSEAPYDKIQDVSYRVKGVWGTLLRFGTLVIQTAGTTTNLELYFVRDPKEVHHLISETMAARLAGPPGERGGKVSALLEAAANLSSAEARAFLVELKGAVDSQEQEPSAGASDRDVRELMTGDDE